MSFELLTPALEERPTSSPSLAMPGKTLNIKRLIQYRLPLIIGITLLVSVPSVIVSWLLTPAEYTASADIRFLASTPRVMANSDNQNQFAPYEKFVNTQIGLITGNMILTDVANDPDIRGLACFPPGEDPVEFLTERVRARTRTNSELVTVSCTLADKESARAVLDKVISQYLTYATGEEVNTGGERLRILTRERDARQTELEMQLRQISELQSTVGPSDQEGNAATGGEADIYRENLYRAEEEISRAEAQVAKNDAELGRIDALAKQVKDGALIPEIEVRVASDARVAALRQELVQAEASAAVMDDRLLENAPQRKTEARRVSVLKESIAKEESAIRQGIVAGMRTDWQMQAKDATDGLNEAKQRAEKFRQLLKDYDDRQQRNAGQRAELDKLKAKADETSNLLRELRRQIADITIESNAPARVRLASQPTALGGRPDYGRRKKMILMALMASLGLGLGAGILRELTNREITSAQDISLMTSLPVVAVIPDAAEDAYVKSDRVYRLVLDYPKSALTNEMRRVLSKLLYPAETSDAIRSILMTSPSKGDGKTMLTCNLAVALAQSGRRVLIVDACSQGSDIEDCFHMENGPGLSELLTGELDLREVARQTDVENVWLLGPGLDIDALRSRLASKSMVDFLQEAESDFDHVLFDAPPALLMSEAYLIAPLVDMVLVVVRAGVSNEGMTHRCLRELQQIQANVAGIVLNGLRGTRGGYLKHNVRSYYGYRPSGNGNGNGHSGDLPEIQLVEEAPEETGEAVLLAPAPESTKSVHSN